MHLCSYSIGACTCGLVCCFPSGSFLVSTAFPDDDRGGVTSSAFAAGNTLLTQPRVEHEVELQVGQRVDKHGDAEHVGIADRVRRTLPCREAWPAFQATGVAGFDTDPPPNVETSP